MSKLRALRFALLTAVSVHAAVHQGLDELDAEQDFDFIVVGGGIGGSVVASRLSENPDFKVLLVEAGPDNDGVLDIAVPGYTDRINSTYDWRFRTEPQIGLNNRTFSYDRGHVLGGSSSVNSMIYTRGAAEDYDRWAEVTGDSGWTWDALFPLIKRHEKFVPPPGGRNVTGQYNPDVHGYEGNSLVSLPWSEPTEFDKLCLKNAEAQKDEFPFNIDQNSGSPVGLTWMQSTIGNGERSSAATAYLGNDVRARPNLSILLNTYATRAIPVAHSGEGLDVRTIELAPRHGAGSSVTLTARKELILTAGAFGTPHILLNSGIGDREELADVGVETIHHLPDVGKDLHDHVFASVMWTNRIPAPRPVSPAQALAEWQANRTGPLTEAAGAGHQVLWSRIASDSPIFEEHDDPASGVNAPHIETFLAPSANFLMSGVVLLTPYSRGTIKLRSNDPFDPPRIDLALLTHPFDVLALKEGIRNTRRFFSGPVWEGYSLSTFTPNPDTVPADEYERYLRGAAGTFGHAVGTASMSAKGSDKGVLDPDLHVKGVSGLRVVDASAIPFVPAAHSQAAVYILAERAVDLIRETWN
ncbi:aryl-alcohol oxidase [Coprinopsis cinerea AmutBmut pab1-1]|nr:aryl-alcohol oxidase [Coprinopsis cinerea AmutBmut pab1-1]